MSDDSSGCLLDDCVFLDVVPPAGIDITEAQSMQSLNFKQKVTLRFYNIRAMERQTRDEAERAAELEAIKEAEQQRLIEEKRRKYEIVDRIRAEIAVKEASR